MDRRAARRHHRRRDRDAAAVTPPPSPHRAESVAVFRRKNTDPCFRFFFFYFLPVRLFRNHHQMPFRFLTIRIRFILETIFLHDLLKKINKYRFNDFGR